MDFQDLRRNWDAFGRTDPLWAIKTDPAARGGKWDLEAFWETGEDAIASVLAHAGSLGLPKDHRRALDFGCGVGRLTRPLGRRFEEAVGVDVAASMIDLGRGYLEAGEPVEYVLNEDEDLAIFDDASFDLVFTLIVLQHMAPRYSARYMAEFIRILRPGGVAIFQIPAGVRPMRALPAEAYRAQIELLDAELEDSGQGRVKVAVTHAGTEAWTEDQAIFVANHWRSIEDASMVVNDDGRADVPVPMAPGTRFEAELHIMVPDTTREYILEVDLVADEIGWFEAFGSPVLRLPVTHDGDDGPSGPSAPQEQTADSESEGLPVMEVYGTPRETVEQIVTQAGGRVVDAVEDDATGRSWLSYTYYATKD